MHILAQMGWSVFLLAMMLISICALLMLVIMIQRGRGSGLAGAFGGAGGGGGAFGAKTGDILTWITVSVASVFLLLTAVANHIFDQSPDQPTQASSLGVTAEPESPDPETVTLPIEITPTAAPDATGDTSAADSTTEELSTATPPDAGGTEEDNAAPDSPSTSPGEPQDRLSP